MLQKKTLRAATMFAPALMFSRLLHGKVTKNNDAVVLSFLLWQTTFFVKCIFILFERKNYKSPQKVLRNCGTIQFFLVICRKTKT
jgi:hypothetical protein